MPLKTAGRSSLVDQVIDQLRELVETGEWPVGMKIPAEPVLVQTLGVGRNTVREAVRALVHNGMLEPRQGDGTYVRADDELGVAVRRRCHRAGLHEALEVRACLERDAARLAATRRTEDDLVALRAALAIREAAWLARDDAALVVADLEFHRISIAAAHNGMLADLYGHLTEGMRAVVETVVHGPQDDEARYQRAAHAGLLAAIEAGDPDAAQRCVEHYLDEADYCIQLMCEADV